MRTKTGVRAGVYGALAVLVIGAAVAVLLVRAGVLTLPDPVTAEPPRARLPERTLDDLVEMYRASGYPFQPGVEAIHLAGVLQTPAGRFLAVRDVARSGRARFVIADESGVRGGWIVDGSEAWLIEDGRARDAGSAAESLRVLAEHDPLFVDAEARGHTVIRIDRRDAGPPAYVVEVRARDGSGWEYELDPSRGVVRKLTRTWEDDSGGKVRVEMVTEQEFIISRNQYVFQRESMTSTRADTREVSSVTWSRLGVARDVDARRFRPEGLPSNTDPPASDPDSGDGPP